MKLCLQPVCILLNGLVSVPNWPLTRQLSRTLAGKDYVSCINVICRTLNTKSNINHWFVNQAYIQLIPNKMDSNPEILESLLKISSYIRE